MNTKIDSQPKSGVEHAADERREHRHEHHHEGDQPIMGAALLAVVEIADDGAADGRPVEAPSDCRTRDDDQARDVAAKKAAVLGNGRERKSGKHDGPAAEAVGERPEGTAARSQARAI